MTEDIVENLKQPSQWFRLLFMLGFVVVLYVAGLVLLAITLAQALFSLLTARDNMNLREFGASLNCYVFDILQFLTYNSEEKPFPFAPFPLAESDTNQAKSYRKTAPTGAATSSGSAAKVVNTGAASVKPKASKSSAVKTSALKNDAVKNSAAKTKTKKPAATKPSAGKPATDTTKIE